MEHDANKQRGAEARADARNCNNAMLDAFRRFSGYMTAAMTPQTKLISSGSLTRRQVLAANTDQHIVRVSTTRTEQGALPDVEFVESMAVPLPHDRSGLLGFIPYDTKHNTEPVSAESTPVVERGRKQPPQPYGPATLIDYRLPEWGFASLVQDCVRQWAANMSAVTPGDDVRAKHKAFAEEHVLAFDPETQGRTMLNPHPDLVPPGNPFAPLIALNKMLPERTDRLLLYRTVGIEMMKLVYALRARYISDPRGMGLKPEARTHEKADVLRLARVHAETDHVKTNNTVENIALSSRQELVTTVWSMYGHPLTKR